MLSRHLFASGAICAIAGSLAIPWGPQGIVGQLRAFDQASCSASHESATLDLSGAPGCRRLPGDWVAGSIQVEEAQDATRSPMLAYLYTDAACRQGGRRLLPGQCVDDLSDKVWRSYVVMGSRTLELRQEEEKERTLTRRQEEEEEEELALARRQEEEGEERNITRRQEEEEEERTITRRQEEEE